MSVLPLSVEKVIEEFGRLPGVGPKSAARMAYHFLRSSRKDASRLAKVLLEMEEKVVDCTMCFNVSDSEVCAICSSPLRDSSKICIVEDPLDVVAFENAGVFKGVYFVLGGLISPADGIGADELRFKELKARINAVLKDHEAIEIIIATNPNLEGEATSNYITDMISSMEVGEKVKVSRLAMGLPTGADLEYADQLTLKRSFEGRNIL
ncbi:recombination protein RecR [Candidatus Dojkabacteria bacterium]|nr:recombination protein RecR [Candidatus Dojkabacteria bacterium]